MPMRRVTRPRRHSECSVDLNCVPTVPVVEMGEDSIHNESSEFCFVVMFRESAPLQPPVKDGSTDVAIALACRFLGLAALRHWTITGATATNRHSQSRPSRYLLKDISKTRIGIGTYKRMEGKVCPDSQACIQNRKCLAFLSLGQGEPSDPFHSIDIL
jgi:hypothetical protein